MNFATWSIRNPIPVILLFALLAIAGMYGFHQLPIQNLPDLDLPTVNVTLTQPGAAPSQLETQVARKVENSLATVAGLKHVMTSITDGMVQLRVEFVLEKKLSDALIDTKDAIDRVRSDLPTDLLPPTISAVTIGGAAMLTYAIALPALNEEELSWFVDDTVSKAMLAVPGVGRFERLGGVSREVLVEVDPVRLAGHGVTASEVSRALREVQQQSSGGLGRVGEGEQALRTIATVRTASELETLPLALANGRELRIDQVATVNDTIQERSQAALLNGRPAIGFSIYRAKGFDETRIAAAVAASLERLKEANPELSLTLVSGSVAYTREQYRGSMDMLFEGALLAILVVWWFLRDWRATLIAASALPLSILPAFAAMAWLGYSLNTLTLLALAVVVGILVDDAIVEIENIERHAHMGKSMLQAAGDAVTEIALAVVATTLTLVVVFLPTAQMSGIPGLFFKQFGWTAVIAVLASLLVARLLTPMLAAYFLRIPAAATHRPRSRLMRAYLEAVNWCLGHRASTMSATVALFVASIALVPLIPTGLVPPADRGFSTVGIELPPGHPLSETVRVAELARLALQRVTGIRDVFAAVGSPQESGGNRSNAGEVRRASLTLALSPRDSRPSQADIERAVRRALADVPGARLSVGGGGPGERMSLILASDSQTALMVSSSALERELRDVPGLGSIRSTASLERPEIVIRPDRQRAAERGVTTAVIGDTVRIATAGDFDSQLSKLDLDNRQIGIRVRLADVHRQDLESISNLRVPSRNGQVPLSTVAALSLESGPSQIDRYDRRRNVTIDADLSGLPLGTALAAAKSLPAAKNLPSGVEIIPTGDAELAGELMTSFAIAMFTGVLCVYCVLVLLFKDFLQPVTILSAIPLSLGGAFVALLAAHSELDVPAMIGLVMLMGIVTKNSILLVEYAIVARRDRNLSLHDALMDACHKRARPIVMTTVAMIAGMLPIAFGFGADASFRQPMAIAVIGGLISSTALSLLVVPALFTYVDKLESLVKGIWRKASPSPSLTSAVSGPSIAE